MGFATPIFAFVAAAALLTITPGVDTALVLRSAATAGPRSASAAAAGIGLGCLVWGVGAAFGLTTLLAASTIAFTVVKIAGAAYLVLLGINLLTTTRRAAEPLAAPSPPTGSRAAFRRGFLTNLMNPKVGVFYITFLPQFIPPGVNVAVFSLLLATIHVVMGLVWFALLIALTAPLSLLLAKPALRRWLDRLTGLVFIAFGVKLALVDRR